MKQATLCFGCLLLTVFLTGCGDVGQLSNLVPVTGTVMLDGQPLPQGSIGFVPVNPDGHSASGQIQDGQFKMVTTVSSQGVVAGDYQVFITSFEQTPVPEAPGKSEHVPMTLHPPPESLIPKKYGDIATSGLEAIVTPGMAPVQFDLDSSEE